MIGVVRHGADGSVSWHGDREVVLGPIVLEMNGIRITVDSAVPDEALDIAAADGPALRAASVLFAAPEVVGELLAAPDGSTTPGPILGPDAQRLATACAVNTLHLGDLDAGVVLLDEAYARSLAGDPDARHGFALVAAVPDRLVDEFTVAGHVGPAVDRLLAIIAAAPTGVIPEARRQQWIRDLSDATAQAEMRWGALLDDVVARESALTLGGAQVTSSYLADFRALPPRLLVYRGPDDAEIEIERGLDAGVRVSAEVRTEALIDEIVRDGVFAIAADPEDGAILGFAPAEFRGGRLEATIGLSDGEIGAAVYAFVDSGVDIATLRLDRFGLALTRIDRHCRHAWTQHRTAGAIRASLGIDDVGDDLRRAAERADALHAEAGRAMTTAATLLARLSRRHRSGPRADALRRYAAGVDVLGERMLEPPTLDGPMGPTLSELHSVALR